MSELLAIRGLRRRFGATVALDGVDLDVGAGEVHALLGENGAGKSTLVRIVAGAMRPDGGTLSIDGVPYAPRDPLAARRAGVAMIHQELAIAPHLSVAENVLLGAEPRRGLLVDRRALRRRAAEALAALGRGELDLDLRAAALGPAERQLVEVARALVQGCRLLILDEPTSSLSAPDVERLFAVVARLRAAGAGVVYISHALEEVRRVADRFTVLRDGRVAGGGIAATTAPSTIVSMMIGRTPAELYPPAGRAAGEVLLEIDELSGVRLPRNATLSLRRGEILGIAGLVGAGRTELLRCIFGLDPVRRGSVRVARFGGRATARGGPPQRWRAGVGLVPEERALDGLLLGRSIAENIAITRLAGLGPAGLALSGRMAAEAQRWIGALGIRCAGPGQAAGELSGGNQQKVVFARLLRHGCDVLLLDEPTRGVDIAARAAIYRLVDEAARGTTTGRPCAVLIASSDLGELVGLCDRIAVMHRGRLAPARPASEWDEHTLLLAASGAAEAA